MTETLAAVPPDWTPATVRRLSKLQDDARFAGKATSARLAYHIDHALECFAALLEGGGDEVDRLRVRVEGLQSQIESLAEHLAAARGEPVAVANSCGGFTVYGGRFVGKGPGQ